MQRRKTLFLLVLSLVYGLFSPALHGQADSSAAGLQDSLKVVTSTNSAATASQKKVDALASQAQALLEEYRQLLDTSAYQQAYTRELQERDRAQSELILELEGQIVQARITRQRIIPLMRSMAEALEKFVILDLPFHHEDRISAVLALKRHLEHGELSVAARFRLLLETYQLEQAYGSNIEAWRGPLQLEGENLSVEFLRVGRVALYFQTLDGLQSGYWNRALDSWERLQPSHNRDITRGLRVANNVSAPQLLNLPLLGNGGS